MESPRGGEDLKSYHLDRRCLPSAPLGQEEDLALTSEGGSPPAALERGAARTKSGTD